MTLLAFQSEGVDLKKLRQIARVPRRYAVIAGYHGQLFRGREPFGPPFREAQKIATIRLKFRVHPRNPGSGFIWGIRA
jgi:hypothetical protein